MVNSGERPANEVDVFSLASRWRSSPEWSKIEQEIDAEPVPSQLNTINSSGLFHIVSTDKMSVQYVGNPQHGHDVGVVQADCPAPTRRSVYYFEMTVKNAGEKGQMSIGFTNEQFKMRRQPGWEANSCGYHGDDGYLYQGPGKGEPFGPKFTTGDTVGAGINYGSREFFFTRNGKFVGSVNKDIKGPIYPTIAVHSRNEEVTVNFGKQPFDFDSEAYIWKERLEQQRTFEELLLSPNASHRIIRSYLLHYGYQDTLNSYDEESESVRPPNSQILENGFDSRLDVYALNHRKILRQLIMKGDIDSAFGKLREWYPQAVQDDASVVCFLLHCQRFIEYIQAGLLEGAVAYAQAQLTRYFSLRPFLALLEDVIGLMAYIEPSKSCVGYLLDVTQREFVADAVNAVILSTNPNAKADNFMQTCLEKLLRQLTLCTLEYRSLNGDQGEAFFLHKELQNSRGGKRS